MALRNAFENLAVESKQDTIIDNLQTIIDNTDTLEIQTDGLEALQQATIDAINASGSSGEASTGTADANPGPYTVLGRLKTLNNSITTFDQAFDDRDLSTETTQAAVLAAIIAEAAATQNILQSEFDATQTLVTAFKDEVKAESDASQAILTSTQTVLTDTQNLIQTEADESQAILTATQNLIQTESDASQAILTEINNNTGLNSPDGGTKFKRVLKFEPYTGEEMRADEIQGGDLYHGLAKDGDPTSGTTWSVVRFYRDPATAKILRVRFRTSVAWDDRLVGW